MALCAGQNPRMRIALCGLEGEHEMPRDWDCVAWKARGGYGSQRRDGTNDNRRRERTWFSPACVGGGFAEEEERLPRESQLDD